MAIIVNGYEHRTLAQPLYVNGKQVMEAYANGVKVYPDRQAFVVKFGAVEVGAEDGVSDSKAVFIVTSDTHIRCVSRLHDGSIEYGFYTFPDELRTREGALARLKEAGWRNENRYGPKAVARGTWDIYGTIKFGNIVVKGRREVLLSLGTWTEYYATPETLSIMEKINGKTLCVGRGNLDGGAPYGHGWYAHGCEVAVECDDGSVSVQNRYNKPISGMEGIARFTGDGGARVDNVDGVRRLYLGPGGWVDYKVAFGVSLPTPTYYMRSGGVGSDGIISGSEYREWMRGEVTPFVSDKVRFLPQAYNPEPAYFTLTKVLYSNSPLSYSHEPTEEAPPSAYVVSESDFSMF